MSLPDWPRAHGAPLIAAIIRSKPEDFDVTEELGFELSGDGEHDFVYVEKTGTNTQWLSRQLAGFAGVAPKEVGYSGLKDRHAVTRQWFSVPRWNQPDWAAFDVDGVRILDLGRNARKLRRGAHRKNRFKIVLRPDEKGLEKGSDPSSAASISEDAVVARLQAIREAGVPNYFGPQRFGRGGGNIELANSWAAGKRLPRHKRSIAISSARSYLFNQLLAARVNDKSWGDLVAGDVANLDGSGSVFAVEQVDEDIKARCKSMDIHPTAIMWGDGSSESEIPTGRENWLDALRSARVAPARRSTRLKVDGLSWQFERDSLVLEFSLCRGAFATSVLREIASTG